MEQERNEFGFVVKLFIEIGKLYVEYKAYFVVDGMMMME
jgi:hypothetical protein